MIFAYNMKYQQCMNMNYKILRGAIHNERKINKRTTKDSIEYLELQCIVNNKIHDYISKYHNYPKYIKLPL